MYAMQAVIISGAILTLFFFSFFSRYTSGVIEISPKPRQQLLFVDTACNGTNPQATISWKRFNGDISYTLYRSSPGTSWNEIEHDILLTSYEDINFPEGAGNYQYQLMTTGSFSSVAYSKIKSIAIPSCDGSPTDPPPPPDTTPPTITLTSPAHNSTVAGNMHVVADASDNVGVTGVTFLIDGVPVAEEDTSTPYELVWDSTTIADATYAITAQAQDSAGNKTTSATTNITIANTVNDSLNLIQNPSLEIVGMNGDPEDWFRGGWGTNTRKFTYPVAGFDGIIAGKVEVTSYTNGDAKWYFEDVPVTPGKVYTLSHGYKANVPTQVMVRFQTPLGIAYKYLTTLPPASTWTTSSIDITAPADATALTVFHMLVSVGVLEIDTYALGIKSDPVSSPSPSPNEGNYVMLNAITWGSNLLQNLPLSDISEATYFVLPVDAAGNLLGSDSTLETKFVSDVKAKGKKATVSIAGGAQNTEHITSALTTNRTALINNIDAHLKKFGYSGVVLDIENTSLPSHVMPEFVNQLRARIGSAAVIGVYVQPWQINTVHEQLQEAADAVTWIAPMIYDFTYTMADLKTLTLAWLPKVKGNRSKLLAGVAVNYPTGLSVEQYHEVLQWINAEGLGGVGIWQNTLFTQPWIDAQRAVWQTIQ